MSTSLSLATACPLRVVGTGNIVTRDGLTLGKILPNSVARALVELLNAAQDANPAPAPLDPRNPEDWRRVVEFVETEYALPGEDQRPIALACAAFLRRADRLDRERAEAEQDDADRERAEEIAMVAWADGDGYAQWHNAPEQHRTDLIAAALAGIRAGRAEVATNG